MIIFFQKEARNSKLVDWLAPVQLLLQFISICTKVSEKLDWSLLNPDLKIGAIQLRFSKLIIMNCPELQLGENEDPPNCWALAQSLTDYFKIK